MTNRQRGILAEFIVASSLNLQKSPREEWDAYDLVTDCGLKIEIKSASYIQSWNQKEFSKINFSIKPTIKWENDNRSKQKVRQADIYIFCLLACKDSNVINPMELNQWEFYVLPTCVLDERLGDQKSLSLSKLMKLNPMKAEYSNLGDTISTCFQIS